MTLFVEIVYVLVTVLLILVVLLQAGRGGGLGTALGGGASQGVFGGGGGADFLAKLTQGLAAGFMICAVYLAYASAHTGSSRLTEGDETEQELFDPDEPVNYELVGEGQPMPLPEPGGAPVVTPPPAEDAGQAPPPASMSVPSEAGEGTEEQVPAEGQDAEGASTPAAEGTAPAEGTTPADDAAAPSEPDAAEPEPEPATDVEAPTAEPEPTKAAE